MSAVTILLRRSEVERRVGLGKVTIYRRMKEGSFPKPVKDPCSRSVRWVEQEVQDWILARVSAR